MILNTYLIENGFNLKVKWWSATEFIMVLRHYSYICWKLFLSKIWSTQTVDESATKPNLELLYIYPL